MMSEENEKFWEGLSFGLNALSTSYSFPSNFYPYTEHKTLRINRP